uniref:Uncharacterized protein n=1 Tax=Arundo donax TaxID=35708 RepID=A0A0A8YVH7_ARUDO
MRCIASERGFAGLAVLWGPELFFLLVASQRDEQIMDQMRMGCVPSRCGFTMNSIPFLGTGGYCGSFQSRCAMVLLLIPVLGFSSSSGGCFGDGFRRWALCSDDPKDLVAIFLFSRVLCAIWCDVCPLCILWLCTSICTCGCMFFLSFNTGTFP